MTDLREGFASLEEGVRAAVLGVRAQMWTSLPGIIVSYDAAKNTAEVQPAVQGIRRKEDGKLEYETLPVCPDVPVCFPHGGGYTMTIPIKKGDEVELRFAARNIDGWWDQGDVQKPLDRRMHDLSDAMAFPGPMSKKKTIKNISTDKLQIRSDEDTPKLLVELDTAGKKVSIKNDGLTIVIDKNSGKITITAPTEIVLDCPLVTLTGELKAVGEITAKKNSDNIHVTTHLHSGVTSGPSQTAPPVAGT